MIDHKKKCKPNLSIKTYEKAMRKHKGYVTSIAEELGVCVQAVYQRINHSKKLQQIKEELEEKMKDRAENVLKTALNDGNLTATIFYLKTKCRDRGYSERIDTNVSGQIDHNIRIEKIERVIIDPDPQQIEYQSKAPVIIEFDADKDKVKA